MCGRVFTARAVPTAEIPPEPYVLQIAAVDALKAGEVLVVEGQSTCSCSFWGELLTTACVHKGVHGVVMTACTRDMWKINDLAFPIFGIGYHPGDDKGRLEVVEIGKPITIAGVKTKPGDLLLGDEDGVVIIPSEAAGEVIRRAREKASGENLVRDALAAGMPSGSIQEIRNSLSAFRNPLRPFLVLVLVLLPSKNKARIEDGTTTISGIDIPDVL